MGAEYTRAAVGFSKQLFHYCRNPSDQIDPLPGSVITIPAVPDTENHAVTAAGIALFAFRILIKHCKSLNPDSSARIGLPGCRTKTILRPDLKTGIMQVLIVIDAQNEFSENGKRPVPNHIKAVEAIRKRVEEARQKASPVAWVRHFNKPNESPAFVPGTWGAEYYQGFGPQTGFGEETEFIKNVYGAFTGSDIGHWLKKIKASTVLITGFYTHGCVSTTAREAIMEGLEVLLDPDATGACNISNPLVGSLSADEIRISSLLQLANMGARILPPSS
ncbi:MAG: cysteine hydrolase [Sphingobacteriales bacterium]|nr:cysteine hydrolase [Sphingobacteriales bacterium]